MDKQLVRSYTYHLLYFVFVLLNIGYTHYLYHIVSSVFCA